MKKINPLRGDIIVPGDKSITHRAILFGAVAQGQTCVKTTSLGRDNFASMRCMRQLGVSIEGSVASRLLQIATEESFGDLKSSSGDNSEILIFGKGFAALKPSSEPLFCGNSGTTARLLCGILAGRSFSSELRGDESLSERPFARVVEPLEKMGAKFSDRMFGSESSIIGSSEIGVPKNGPQKIESNLHGSRNNRRLRLPLFVQGNYLNGIDYQSPRASAQIKSAILLAGLQAKGLVSVSEPRKSRDHTERMFLAMGCETLGEETDLGGWRVSLPEELSQRNLKGVEIIVPGDFSAAAFFIVGACVVPGSNLMIRNVGFNPTRIGLYHLLMRMGAKIELRNQRVVCGEEVVDLEVSYSKLKAIEVSADDVVLAIDEIPILAVALGLAEGSSVISGAEELRIKESDRLAMIAQILKSFSIEVEERSDGLIITGQTEINHHHSRGDLFSLWRRSGDHRIAMAGAILEHRACGTFEIEDTLAVDTSFPDFSQYLQMLTRQ